jgi:hypothetical protein
MDVHDEPELECCVVCKRTFLSSAYSGGSDICDACFEDMQMTEGVDEGKPKKTTNKKEEQDET